MIIMIIVFLRGPGRSRLWIPVPSWKCLYTRSALEVLVEAPITNIYYVYLELNS